MRNSNGGKRKRGEMVHRFASTGYNGPIKLALALIFLVTGAQGWHAFMDLEKVPAIGGRNLNQEFQEAE